MYNNYSDSVDSYNTQNQSEEDEASPDPEPEIKFQNNRSEVRRRVKMAEYYSAIIDGGLFHGDDSDEAAIVEMEMREYANSRMETLVGIRQESTPEVVQVQSQFSDDEVRTLKALAASAMRKFSTDQPPQLTPLKVSTPNAQVAVQKPGPKLKIGANLPKPIPEKQSVAKNKPEPKKELAKKGKGVKVPKTGSIGRPADALPIQSGHALSAAYAMKAQESIALSMGSQENQRFANNIENITSKGE